MLLWHLFSGVSKEVDEGEVEMGGVCGEFLCYLQKSLML